MHINGADLVFMLTSLAIEMVNSTSASDRQADLRLIDLANNIEAFARDVKDPRARSLMAGLAHGLIATEAPL
jgi:protein-tyrosine-phosphatase